MNAKSVKDDLLLLRYIEERYGVTIDTSRICVLYDNHQYRVSYTNSDGEIENRDIEVREVLRWMYKELK